MGNPLAYDNELIKDNLLYPICGSYLHSVSQKDYKEVFFHPEIMCLDMDDLELILATNDKRDRQPTVDAVIGVKKFHKNKFSSHSLLLIELRLDYKSADNLSKRKLEEKVRHTVDILSTDAAIYKEKFFIFRDNVIQQMINWFNNHSHEGGIFSFCRPLSVTQFNKTIISPAEFPYEPVNNAYEIRKSLKCTEIEDFFNKIEYWLSIGRQYQYNKEEFNLIISILKEQWQQFRASNKLLTELQEIQAQIIEEDNTELLN